jgi:hypothetical protein
MPPFLLANGSGLDASVVSTSMPRISSLFLNAYSSKLYSLWATDKLLDFFLVTFFYFFTMALKSGVGYSSNTSKFILYSAFEADVNEESGFTAPIYVKLVISFIKFSLL